MILFISLVIGGIVGTSAFLQADAGGWRIIGWAALAMVLAYIISAFKLSSGVFELDVTQQRFGLAELGAIAFWAIAVAFVGAVIGKLATRHFTPGRIGTWTFTLTAATVWSAIWIGAFL